MAAQCGIGKCFLSAYRDNIGANALCRKAGGQTCIESRENDTVYWFSTSQTL